MSAGTIEHRGVVQKIEDGLAIVVMETSGCSACGQGGSCGIGKMAAGRPATVLTLPATPGIAAGDMVSVALPASRLTLAALLGYLFPAFAMLVGAWLGAALAGSDGATALGAIVGFVAALVIARVAVALLPGLMPMPQLQPLRANPQVSQQEFHHEH